jgi:hypothetical protein
MSAEKSNTFLVSLGIATAVLTIGVQVSSIGEIKGRLETTVHIQDKRITAVETTVREHDRLIYQSLTKPKNETSSHSSRSSLPPAFKLSGNSQSLSDQEHGN